MYAVVQLGSLQLKVAEGDLIAANRLEDQVGEAFDINDVLLYSDGKDIRVGQPRVEGVTVKAKVVNHYSDRKVTAFKFRRRKDSSTKKGHRQKMTALSIEKIVAK